LGKKRKQCHKAAGRTSSKGKKRGGPGVPRGSQFRTKNEENLIERNPGEGKWKKGKGGTQLDTRGHPGLWYVIQPFANGGGDIVGVKSCGVSREKKRKRSTTG